MENDIIAESNPVQRRGRPARMQAKPEVEAEPARKTTRVRPQGGVLADRLAVPDYIKRAYPDCVFFFENDEKGKIQIRESRGWEVVKGCLVDGVWHPGGNSMNSGSVYSIPVGQGETKHDLQAVLMALPEEWYQDDIKAQEEASREARNALRRGSNNQDVNPDGTYAPRLPNGKYGFSQELGTK